MVPERVGIATPEPAAARGEPDPTFTLSVRCGDMGDLELLLPGEADVLVRDCAASSCAIWAPEGEAAEYRVRRRHGVRVLELGECGPESSEERVCPAWRGP